MSLQKLNPRTLVLLAFIVAIAAVRVLFSLEKDMSPLATFTPLGAMALFGGAYFKNRVQAYLFPLLTLWLGDIILNRLVYYGEWRIFYEGFYFTYGAYALMVFAGQRIVKQATVQRVVVASLTATLIHWIGTSPSCFLIPDSIYPATWEGYLASLMGAIPYERNFLIGTLAYSGLLFGAFEWMKRRYAALEPAQ